MTRPMILNTASVYKALNTAPPPIAGKLDAMYGRKPPAETSYELLVRHLDHYWLVAVIDHDKDNASEWFSCAFELLTLVSAGLRAVELPGPVTILNMLWHNGAMRAKRDAATLDMEMARHLHAAFARARREAPLGVTREFRLRWHRLGAFADLLRVASGPADRRQEAVRMVQHHLVQAAGYEGHRMDFALLLARYIKARALGDFTAINEIMRSDYALGSAHAA